MNDATRVSANTYQGTIDKITAAQAQNAIAGARVHINITDANGDNVYLSPAVLQQLLGSTSYNTICGTALTSINTALASAKTTAQTALAAL